MDHMYNQMQNLFLEAFERFQGALIAKTDLLQNLEPAFSRRFNVRLGFHLSDAAICLKQKAERKHSQNYIQSC